MIDWLIAGLARDRRAAYDGVGVTTIEPTRLNVCGAVNSLPCLSHAGLYYGHCIEKRP